MSILADLGWTFMQPIDLTFALKATDGDLELLKTVVEAFWMPGRSMNR